MDIFLGRDGLTEYLLTEWPDGTRTLALRSVAGGTWSAPVTLQPEALVGGAA